MAKAINKGLAAQQAAIALIGGIAEELQCPKSINIYMANSIAANKKAAASALAAGNWHLLAIIALASASN